MYHPKRFLHNLLENDAVMLKRNMDKPVRTLLTMAAGTMLVMWWGYFELRNIPTPDVWLPILPSSLFLVAAVFMLLFARWPGRLLFYVGAGALTIGAWLSRFASIVVGQLHTKQPTELLQVRLLLQCAGIAFLVTCFWIVWMYMVRDWYVLHREEDKNKQSQRV